MPDRVEVHDITCPASTPTNAPIEIPFNDDPADLVRVRIVIPDGHSGLTGIALAYGHQPVLPRSRGAFISGNDEVIPFEMSNYPYGVPWSAFVCNLDLQPHTWEIRLEYNELRRGESRIVIQPASVADLNAAADNLIQQGVIPTPVATPIDLPPPTLDLTGG